MAKSKKYLYRKKAQYFRSGADKKWLSCTETAKQKIDKMFPNVYDFKLTTPPEPTPNMVKKETETKKKDK